MTAQRRPDRFPRLRWYQFRLRTLLVLVLVCVTPCIWFASRMQKARKQKAAVAAIRNRGGEVFYDYQFEGSGLDLHAPLPGPEWLRDRLGIDFLADVYYVGMESSTIRDSDIEPVRDLPRLRWLRLTLSGITDAGLQQLEGLTSLERLAIENTKVTEDGVTKFRRAVPNCKIEWTPPTTATRKGPSGTPWVVL